MEPKVTVIIAHKDYQEYLGTALESCLLQTYPCHICIVDDGSLDKQSVKNIILPTLLPNGGDITIENGGFAEIYHHKHFTLILMNENQGPSIARNVGISVTQDFTDYYVILDADDIMRHNKVELLLSVMKDDPNIGVAYADLTSINTETGFEQREFREPFSYLRLMSECIVHSGAMISKIAMMATLENDCVYDPEMRTCEDYDLWIRIAEQFVIVHLAEDLTIIRIQPQNSSVTVDNSIWVQNWNRIRQKVAIRETNKQQVHS